MLSKSQIKFIRSLHRKKERYEHNLFLAEGDKVVTEFLKENTPCQLLAATSDWLSTHPQLLSLINGEVAIADMEMLASASAFVTPPPVMAVFSMQPTHSWSGWPLSEFAFALDTIQDPGNLGTIIRTADWFGISTIIAEPGTADLYNPKVIQASMGSALRVRCIYHPLTDALSHASLPVYAAMLEGESLYSKTTFQPGILLIGNESKGIRKELLTYVSQRLTIPRFGYAESLNAAIATSVMIGWMKGHEVKSS